MEKLYKVSKFDHNLILRMEIKNNNQITMHNSKMKDSIKM